MSALGFSLNLVSLLALTLVTGILVDDAIVEIENIVRHMRMGKSPYRAALEAADEIGLAVIAITFTIVAVFAPVSFMGGIAGQYFKQFGLTVAAAVLISLLVARLITPMLAAYLPAAAQARGGARRLHHARLYARSSAGRCATSSSPSSSASASSPLDLRRRSSCPSASCPRRTSPARCSSSSCRRARRSTTRRPVTDGLAERLRADAGGARPSSSTAACSLPGKKEVRLATLTVNYVPKERAHPAPAAARKPHHRRFPRGARTSASSCSTTAASAACSSSSADPTRTW